MSTSLPFDICTMQGQYFHEQGLLLRCLPRSVLYLGRHFGSTCLLLYRSMSRKYHYYSFTRWRLYCNSIDYINTAFTRLQLGAAVTQRLCYWLVLFKCRMDASSFIPRVSLLSILYINSHFSADILRQKNMRLTLAIEQLTYGS